MENSNTIYFAGRKEWRKWLEKNFEIEKVIWLIYPKKSSNNQRIPYNDAVEEALCFGWIDSTAKTLDNDNIIQRFTPRKPKSSYSQSNIERLKWLSREKMIHPLIEEKVKEIIQKEFVFPSDILDAVKKNKNAWNNYNKFSEAYKRIRIAYIDGARNRPDEFNKRLKNFIEKSEKNKIIGYGGIEKYYSYD